MDMDKWLREQVEAKQKKALPLLSFPGIRFLNGVTVADHAKNQTIRNTHVRLRSSAESDVVSIPNFDGV